MTAYRPKSRRRQVWRPVTERTITINGPTNETADDINEHGFAIEIARPDGSRVRIDPASMVRFADDHQPSSLPKAP